jgi:hypothetical protein
VLRAGLGLGICAAVLIWAHLAVAALTVCLNETPALQDDLRQELPASGAIAASLLPFFWPLGAGDAASPAACTPAAPARAMALAGLAYLLGVFILDRCKLVARIGWLVVCGVAVVIQLSMLLMPALLSSDIIDYASHGRVASLHAANPYVVPPASFPADPFSSLGAWPNVVTVYGPLWTRIDAAVTGALPTGYVAELALAYKALALASVVASAVLIVWIVRSWNSIGITAASPVVALALWVWNPLVNVELVGNAHNEAVMILLVLMAFALLTAATRRARRTLFWLAALTCLWLGALLKFVPAAVAAIVALVWLRQAPTAMHRARRLALLVGIVVPVAIVVAWPWLDSVAVVEPVLGLAAGGQRFKDAWQDAPAAWLTVRVVPRLGVPDDPATLRMDVARVMVWSVTRVLFAAYVCLEAWLLWRRSAASGPAVLVMIASTAQRVLLLAILLYVSQVYAWYFLWPLPLACLVGWRNPSSQAVVILGLCFLPAYYLREFESYGVFYLPIYLLVGLAIVAVIWTGEHRPRLATSG